MSGYDDIINLPHHVSAKRARMSRYDRAAQFSPFAALVGYEDTIREAGRVTDDRVFLSDSAVEEVDRMLRVLKTRAEEELRVCLTYFSPDPRKAGGEKTVITGAVRKIDFYQRTLLLEGHHPVPLEEILRIEILGKTEKI